MKVIYTRIWKVNNEMVVANDIEKAIALYKKAHTDELGYCVNVFSVEVIEVKTNGGTLAILSVDENGEEEKV